MSDRLQEIRDFVRDVDGDLHRTFDFVVEEVRDSGDPTVKGTFTIRGHAAVFNKWSLDLGGFKERVLPGAFDNALEGDPHVLHTWDHDTSKVLSSTRNKTLELRVDPQGLHYWSKVAPTSYAADLRVLLERQDIDQSSFAFTVKKDEWRMKEEDGEEYVERDIIEVDQLFDVTTTAMGAYSQTDSALAVRSFLHGRSFDAGRLRGEAREVVAEEGDPDQPVEPDAGGEPPPPEGDGGDEGRADAEERRQAIADLKRITRKEAAETKNYLSWRDHE